MTYDVCLLAPPDSFARLLLLECKDLGKTVLHLEKEEPLPAAALYVIDADAFSTLPEGGTVLRYGRHLFDTQYQKGAHMVTDLSRPVPLSRLRAFLGGQSTLPSLLSLDEEGHSARLGTRIIPLTPTEYACLRVLLAAGGAPVSREALYAAVWGEGACKADLVNLYLHYLRKKLETDGRRLIFSARGRGYYLKQEEEAL